MTLPIGYFGNTLDPVFPPYHYTIPKIIWGDDLDLTIEIGQPFEGPPATYADPRDKTDMIPTLDGADGWDNGYNYRLDVIVPWIPELDSSSSYGITVTGWYSANGWHAFIKWARSCKTFNLFPDRLVAGSVKSCYLLEPVTQRPDRGWSGGRRLPLKIQAADYIAFEGY